MKYGKKIFTLIFAMFMIAGGLVYEASAQRRVVVGSRRPVIVRQYVYRDPFWRTRYWGSNPYYSGYYNPYFDSPYYRFQEQKFYLERELSGNRRELSEHLRKYRADGVITAKEQRELNDDYKDVRESTEKLRRFNRRY